MASGPAIADSNLALLPGFRLVATDYNATDAEAAADAATPEAEAEAVATRAAEVGQAEQVAEAAAGLAAPL